MPPILVQSCRNDTATTSGTLTFANPTQTGSMVFYFLVTTAATVVVADNILNSYSFSNSRFDGSVALATLGYATAIGGRGLNTPPAAGVTTITYTVSGAGTVYGAGAAEFRGIDTGAFTLPLDTVGLWAVGNEGNNASSATLALAPGTNGDLLLQVIQANGGTIPSGFVVASGWTTLFDNLGEFSTERINGFVQYYVQPTAVNPTNTSVSWTGASSLWSTVGICILGGGASATTQSGAWVWMP